jgi:ATPase subunit of ABC transporter with duplicated ATPase domains
MILARDNPFSTQRVEQLRFRFADGDWTALLQKLEGLNWRGTIVGPNGSGKTTLIEQLVPHIASRGFVPRVMRLRTESTLPEKEAQLVEARTFSAPDFLLLDGAEQLTTRQWLPLRVAIDRLAGAVVTVHRTSRLPTLLELGTTPALLDELVAELTGGQLHPGEAAAILLRHRGNIRDCLRELYDRYSG